MHRALNGIVSLAPQWVRTLGRRLLVFEDRHNALHEWRRERGGPPALEAPVRRVLVICYGNICRSPFAGLLLARRLPGIEVRSAGLEARDGKPAEAGASRMALRHGIDLQDHGAHRMRAEDVEWADLILGMEGWQCARVRHRWPEGAAKTHLLGDFFSHGPFGIADPYGHDDATFTATFDRIALGVEALAARLEAADRTRER